MRRKRKSRKIRETIDRNEAINETTRFRSEDQAEVNLNILSRRRARRTDIPSDVPGIKIPRTSSITEPTMTTKSNTLNDDRM